MKLLWTLSNILPFYCAVGLYKAQIQFCNCKHFWLLSAICTELGVYIYFTVITEGVSRPRSYKGTKEIRLSHNVQCSCFHTWTLGMFKGMCRQFDPDFFLHEHCLHLPFTVEGISSGELLSQLEMWQRGSFLVNHSSG